MHGTGLLLLAAVAGFWTLERAVSHRGRLKQIGQLVGTIVIVVSLVGVACHVWYLSSGKKAGYWKAGKGWCCPLAARKYRSPPATK